MKLNLIAEVGSDCAAVLVPFNCLFLHEGKLLSVVKHEEDIVRARNVESGFHYNLFRNQVVSPVRLSLGSPRFLS